MNPAVLLHFTASLLPDLHIWFAHEHAEDAADYVQDHDLRSSAKILADRLIWEDGDVRASVPPSALSLFMSPARDHVYLSVMDAQGQLLAGQQDFPQPQKLQLSGSDNAQWYDAVWQGQPIRAVITRRAMYDVAGAREITILVGKTTHSRDNMVQTLWWPTMEYLLWGDDPPESGALRTHIHDLRQQIDKNFTCALIETVHGIGWRLREPGVVAPE